MKISVFATAALTLALLTACAPTAPAPAPSAEATEASCAAHGGVIQRGGKLRRPTCVTPYADAGKVCADKAQCQGACILEGNIEAAGPVTGQCQATSVQFGCYAKVVAGKATVTICVD
ncbi:MAG: hypothetical protein KKC14_18370 [Alphaproteobacteria bacterium]|nr:hypothetical protein [Alphaproteobacteria bacterium]